MRILFSSHVFAPSIGGIERVSELLAGEFVRQGHEVRLITQTPADGDDASDFPVYRRPSSSTLFGLVRWCDVFFHNNISLPRAWPLLWIRRPWVVAHHVWIPRRGLAGRAKRLALRYAQGISVSQAVAAHLGTPSVVIPNPYADHVFRILDGIDRDRDLVFVGRLVSDKGVDLLLDAVHTLVRRGRRVTLTVVGEGPEAPALRAKVTRCGLDKAVTFEGRRSGAELVSLLNQHRVIVVPSVWEEPFGIVALEGMACGCVPVVSSGGGLPDAVGDCGKTFPVGDAGALADALEQVLGDDDCRRALQARAADQLARHRGTSVAAAYLEVLDEAWRRAQSLVARGETFRV